MNRLKRHDEFREAVKNTEQGPVMDAAVEEWLADTKDFDALMLIYNIIADAGNGILLVNDDLASRVWKKMALAGRERGMMFEKAEFRDKGGEIHRWAL